MITDGSKDWSTNSVLLSYCDDEPSVGDVIEYMKNCYGSYYNDHKHEWKISINDNSYRQSSIQGTVTIWVEST